MYISTPKRYRGTQRRSGFSCFRLLGMLTMAGLIVVGIGIYQNRDIFAPVINDFVQQTMNEVEVARATAIAPTATPTRNPASDRIQADNFWSRGVVNEALKLYQDIAPAVPNDLNVYYRVTLGLITLGDSAGAVEFAEQTVTANPFSSDAWAIRSWAYDWSGDVGTAISSALYARELNSDNPRALAYLAEAVLAAGQVQRALDLADDALEIDPNSAEAHRARGIIYWTGLFDLVTAEEEITLAYDIARQNNPAMASLYAIDLAQLSIGRQDYDAAISWLDSVLEINPDNGQALFWMGSVYFANLGNFNQASEFLNRCVRVSPESIGCHYLLGRAQSRLELTQDAAANFAKAIELGSLSARHHWWAGNSQIAIGNCGQALEYLNIGYDLAIREGNAQLVDDFNAILPLCQANFGAQAAPTPTPTPDPFADTSNSS